MHEENNTTASGHVEAEPKKEEHAGAGPNVLMAVLAYIGPLVIISYLVAKDEPFVKFHIKQGLILLAIQAVLFVLMGSTMWGLFGLLQLIRLGVMVLSVIGIINAIQKNQKELPLVGGLAVHFKF